MSPLNQPVPRLCGKLSCQPICRTIALIRLYRGFLPGGPSPDPMRVRYTLKKHINSSMMPREKEFLDEKKWSSDPRVGTRSHRGRGKVYVPLYIRTNYHPTNTMYTCAILRRRITEPTRVENCHVGVMVHTRFGIRYKLYYSGLSKSFIVFYTSNTTMSIVGLRWTLP